jgi:hypothetical protein
MSTTKLAAVTLSLLCLAGSLVHMAPTASAEEDAGGYRVVQTLPVGGEGGWDYLTVDAQHKLLFVPRTTHTMVVDAANGKTVADIPGQRRNHGVAIVPTAGRGFISDGQDGSVTVFDLKSYQVLGKVKAAEDADGIIFASCRDGTLAVARETSPGRFAIIQTVRTRVGAKTMGLDPLTHTLYLPVGDFVGGGGKSRPTAKPGSFVVLVVRAAGDPAPAAKQADVEKAKTEAEKAKAALLKLIRDKPGLFVGHPDPERLQQMPVKPSDPQNPNAFHWSAFEIDVRERWYSATISSEALGTTWFYHGKFTIDPAGKWIPAEPQTMEAFHQLTPKTGYSRPH